jgi:hypothetical protein
MTPEKYIDIIETFALYSKFCIHTHNFRKFHHAHHGDTSIIRETYKIRSQHTGSDFGRRGYLPPWVKTEVRENNIQFYCGVRYNRGSTCGYNGLHNKTHDGRFQVED